MSLNKNTKYTMGLSDLLNFAHVIEEGIIINKDGAFLTLYQYQGKDLQSASNQELDAIVANFNQMVLNLEDGWMLHIDEIRIPSIDYPEQGHFPDRVSCLIDEERRQRYEKEGNHFENLQLLSFVWKFPLRKVNKAKYWFVDGLKKEKDNSLTDYLAIFKEKVNRCIGLLSLYFSLRKLTSSELLTCLNTFITGELLPVKVPPSYCFIDVALGRRSLVGGYIPKIGEKHIYVISLFGFLNEEIVPGLLETLGTYPLVYRWSNRFIALSQTSAERAIKHYQKNWNNKVKGLSGIIREAIFGQYSHKLNHHALAMSEEINEVLALNDSKMCCWGYWSSEIVLIHEDLDLLKSAAEDFIRFIEQSGFSCKKEDINAIDAWLGSIPGHGTCNIRRLFINSYQLASFLPLHTTWTGDTFSAKASLLPQDSHPVFYASTTGKTPFRFHLDVEDVGHQLVLGPTGAGKSTYLDLLIAQFLRYPNATIYVFDKDKSHQALTEALDGQYYLIENSHQPCFSPLANLSSAEHKIRGGQFIEDLLVLQGLTITPLVKNAIGNIIEAMSNSSYDNVRCLSVFCNEVQNQEIRQALAFYTLEGPFPLLDGIKDKLALGYLQSFEMGWLLNQQPQIYIPILKTIFNKIEERLEENQGKYPTIIILEEAWAYISHEIFAKKLKDWLKTLRKKNARVVFATQSLADLYNPESKSLTSTTAAILESCHTKVYLPNNAMEAEIKTLYSKMGLRDKQIEIISKVAIPKQDYYIVTPKGERLIELGLTSPKSLALSFIGLSKEKSNQLMSYKEKYKEDWICHWLKKEGYESFADDSKREDKA